MLNRRSAGAKFCSTSENFLFGQHRHARTPRVARVGTSLPARDQRLLWIAAYNTSRAGKNGGTAIVIPFESIECRKRDDDSTESIHQAIDRVAYLNRDVSEESRTQFAALIEIQKHTYQFNLTESFAGEIRRAKAEADADRQRPPPARVQRRKRTRG